jgi:2-aminoadipate transaminase
LAAGFTDESTLPVQDVRELLDQVLGSSRTGRTALQYGTTVGDAQLRELSAEHVRRLDGVRSSGESTCSANRCLLTNGSQQLLYMTAEALCDPGDIVLVEDPTYFVWLGIVQSHRLCARAVRMDEQGLDLAHLEEVLQTLKRNGELRRLKLLYLVSYFQNPTSITTTFERKAGALRLLRSFERAAGHPLFLLEDTAYRELRFHGGEVPSALTAPGGQERVIYAGTYSKPFATGTRVGFGFLPEPLFTVLTRIKANHDFGSSNFLLQLLARALASGRYDRHVQELRERYAGKAAVMAKAMNRHFPPGVLRTNPDGGLYFWASLPRSVKSGIRSSLFRRSLEAGVMYVPGELCYADDPSRRKPNHQMRISFGAASPEQIRLGIARLGPVIKEAAMAEA